MGWNSVGIQQKLFHVGNLRIPGEIPQKIPGINTDQEIILKLKAPKQYGYN